MTDMLEGEELDPSKPNGGRGRPPGSKNKTPKAVLDGILNVFENLGGEVGLVQWVQSDPKHRLEFYKWWARLAPTNVKVGGDGTAIEHDVTQRVPDSVNRLVDELAGRPPSSGDEETMPD